MLAFPRAVALQALNLARGTTMDTTATHCPGSLARSTFIAILVSAATVEDAAVEGFDDLREQPNDAGGGVELAAFLALSSCELAEEVFIDTAKCT